ELVLAIAALQILHGLFAQAVIHLNGLAYVVAGSIAIVLARGNDRHEIMSFSSILLGCCFHDALCTGGIATEHFGQGGIEGVEAARVAVGSTVITLLDVHDAHVVLHFVAGIHGLVVKLGCTSAIALQPGNDAKVIVAYGVLLDAVGLFELCLCFINTVLH